MLRFLLPLAASAALAAATPLDPLADPRAELPIIEGAPEAPLPDGWRRGTVELLPHLVEGAVRGVVVRFGDRSVIQPEGSLEGWLVLAASLDLAADAVGRAVDPLTSREHPRLALDLAVDRRVRIADAMTCVDVGYRSLDPAAKLAPRHGDGVVRWRFVGRSQARLPIDFDRSIGSRGVMAGNAVCFLLGVMPPGFLPGQGTAAEFQQRWLAERDRPLTRILIKDRGTDQSLDCGLFDQEGEAADRQREALHRRFDGLSVRLAEQTAQGRRVEGHVLRVFDDLPCGIVLPIYAAYRQAAQATASTQAPARPVHLEARHLQNFATHPAGNLRPDLLDPANLLSLCHEIRGPTLTAGPAAGAKCGGRWRVPLLPRRSVPR